VCGAKAANAISTLTNHGIDKQRIAADILIKDLLNKWFFQGQSAFFDNRASKPG
jgi:hypothetical protein